MSCTPIQGGILCVDEPSRVTRELDGEPRWCFRCRCVRPFEFVVSYPRSTSWYSPTASVRCSKCNMIDGDLFPGRSREWDE